MKNQKRDINERIQVGIRISEFDYLRGLLFLVNQLFNDYFLFIDQEGRSRGIMIKHKANIGTAFLNLFSNLTEDEFDYCSRIVFLYKWSVYREYRNLSKRLSKADTVITIIRKLLEFIDSKNSSYSSNSDFKTIYDTVILIHDNIRWTSKFAHLNKLMASINEFFDGGLIGKYPIITFSLAEEDDKRENRKPIIQESPITLLEEAVKDTEIEL